MKKQFHTSVIFNRKNQLNSNGEAPIVIRVYLTHSKKSVYLSTGISIQPRFWDERIKRIKTSKNDSFLLNNIIQDILNQLDKLEISKSISGEIVTKENIMHLQNTNELNIIEYYKIWLEKNKSLKRNTIKNHKVTISHLTACFKDGLLINPQFTDLETFQNYLISKGMINNSVAKNIKNFKAAYNSAIKNNLISESRLFKNYKPLKNEVSITFLDNDEIVKIIELNLTNHPIGLERVRDMFLMQCYTGLRFSDVSQLDKNNFETKQNEVFLNVRAVKTGKFLSIPLSKIFKKDEISEPLKIYYKYEDSWDEKPFFMSNQTANKHLKTLGELANLNKTITTHVGRHTFGTNTILILPVHIVREIMQHSSLEQTLKYIGLSKKTLNEQLDLVGDKWFK